MLTAAEANYVTAHNALAKLVEDDCWEFSKHLGWHLEHYMLQCRYGLPHWVAAVVSEKCDQGLLQLYFTNYDRSLLDSSASKPEPLHEPFVLEIGEDHEALAKAIDAELRAMVGIEQGYGL